jgi:hypothetical protein
MGGDGSVAVGCGIVIELNAQEADAALFGFGLAACIFLYALANEIDTGFVDGGAVTEPAIEREPRVPKELLVGSIRSLLASALEMHHHFEAAALAGIVTERVQDGAQEGYAVLQDGFFGGDGGVNQDGNRQYDGEQGEAGRHRDGQGCHRDEDYERRPSNHSDLGLNACVEGGDPIEIGGQFGGCSLAGEHEFRFELLLVDRHLICPRVMLAEARYCLRLETAGLHFVRSGSRGERSFDAY